MYDKEDITNESDRKLVQGFIVGQIQQLTKIIYSINNNDKNDTFVNSTGLLAHNSSSNFAKPLDQQASPSFPILSFPGYEINYMM